MSETSDFTDEIFLEQIKSESDKYAERIRERTPETLDENYEIATESIYQTYYSSRTSERKFPLLALNPEKVRKELQEKAKKFQEVFEERVFNNLTHASEFDISDDDGNAVLQSPEKIALIKNLSVDEIKKHQGDNDKLIGSNGLVFANSVELKSRSNNGKFRYHVNPEGSCVIPMDIADVLPPGHVDEGKYKDVLRNYFISRNIFRHEDFKKYFSLYSASLFSSPEEALDFFKRNDHVPQQAGVWSSDYESTRHSSKEKDKSIMKKIRSLYVHKGLVPPFNPEWQFKDSVEAKILSKTPAY